MDGAGEGASVGPCVGFNVGVRDGSELDGAGEGASVGLDVGPNVGVHDGSVLGKEDG